MSEDFDKLAETVTKASMGVTNPIRTDASIEAAKKLIEEGMPEKQVLESLKQDAIQKVADQIKK